MTKPPSKVPTKCTGKVWEFFVLGLSLSAALDGRAVCLKCFPQAKEPDYELPPEVIRKVKDGEDVPGIVAYKEQTTRPMWGTSNPTSIKWTRGLSSNAVASRCWSDLPIPCRWRSSTPWSFLLFLT